MRRICGFVLLAGTLGVGLTPATGWSQDITGADPAGFGPKGVSNTFGYNIRTSRGVGYMPGLYRPFDNSSESVAYNPIWSSALAGAPRPDVARRGYHWSPPWSAAYRQGQPRAHRLFGRHGIED